MFVGLITLGYGWNVTAKLPTIGEKFESPAYSTKITKEEQMGVYSFDKAHSSINFKVRHLGLVDVPGHFRSFTGTLDFDAKKIKNSTVEFSADMTSVDTGVKGRDNHLRSKDFFEVKTYPKMTFKSTKIKKKGKRYMVTGDFTMKGVTKEIMIPMRLYGPIKDNRDSIRMGVVGSTAINRRDFNVNYGGNLPDGTAVLSDTVVVDLQIESVKMKPKAAADKKDQ
jgi:polyisoprenoid-binding protein YceI